MSDAQQISTVAQKKLLEIVEDPVKWAQVFISVYDSSLKKMTPWIARWYQVDILRDFSLRKVSRWGRRTGKSEAMVVDMLWRTMTNRNYRCLVVTPYENQVRLIFQRLREMIASSPLIQREVIKQTSNPYQIILKNESCIFGFTTGASSGSGGASIRGQRADWIYMDEVDKQKLIRKMNIASSKTSSL